MNLHTEENVLQWMDLLAQFDYVVIDDFISDDLYDRIRSFFDQKLEENDLKKAGIGALADHIINAAIRGDYVYWLDIKRDTELTLFFELVTQLKDCLRRYCYIPVSDYEYHLAYYPAGTYYKRHLDQFSERNNRLISSVLYLNENWKESDGGQLVIYKEDQKTVVNPIRKRLVLFKSDCVPHEVLTTNVPRYSLTGWMLNKPVGLGFLG